MKAGASSSRRSAPSTGRISDGIKAKETYTFAWKQNNILQKQHREFEGAYQAAGRTTDNTGKRVGSGARAQVTRYDTKGIGIYLFI
jgi:hypothetical protein